MCHTTLEEKNTVLLVALELSATTWKLAMGDGTPKGRRSKATVDAGNIGGVLEACAKAEKKFGLVGAQIVSCYEAGRDGFWIHRELEQYGVKNLIVDASSIEVDRRQKRAKTDRLDAERLLAQLTRYQGGEQGALRVVRVPSQEVEDGRRPHRELGRLRKEKTAHSNRMRSLGVLQGQKLVVGPHLREQVEGLGDKLPVRLHEEVLREYERWELVQRQIVLLQRKLRQELKEQPETPAAKIILQLADLRAIGERSAELFTWELFLWRTFDNGRQVGAAVGLTGTPYASGKLDREQGISKAGNRRVRAMLIEIAWCWVRYQPESALTKWFQERFAGTAKVRRIGIVALARKLIIALWRYVRDGEIPEGAVRKSTLAAAA